MRRKTAPPSEWQLAACDVGQGDAFVMRSAGEVALIDTGPDAAALKDCLDVLGIGRIDLLVLTHFDLDHVGGVAAIRGRVERAIVGPASEVGDEQLLTELSNGGAIVEQVAAGRQGVLGEWRWRVLWPRAVGDIEPGNAASVVVAFDGADSCESGCVSAFFLGDLGQQEQSAMLAANRLVPVDVVKVSHHGSRDQEPRLYERLQPAVALIGVGISNTYGHPSDDILRVLSGIHALVARTDRNGMSLLFWRGAELRLWNEKEAEVVR